MSGDKLKLARAFFALVIFVALGGAACGGSGTGGGDGEGGPDAGGSDENATCEGGAVAVCQGDNVHSCNDDGTVGGMIEQCEPGQCYGGTCGGGGGDDNCSTDGNDLIYVVDRDYRLLSFDPQVLAGGGDPFALIGNLDCPSGPSWPGWPGGNPSTPFSMSVDREGMAWVLYTSGEIFKVSISDASCTPSGFQKGQEGFQLFGMGYVSDAAGSSDETLFISGGSAAQNQIGDLGMVSDAMAVTPVGSLPDSESPPELTGTGNGELYAYFPGSFESFVARLSKDSSEVEDTWDLQPLGGDARAWAFAHWGGKFYIFISTEFFGITSQVKVLDPASGMETIAIDDSPYMVVGAGVSTCAPVVVE